MVFDNATKQLYIVHWVLTDEYESMDEAYERGMDALDEMIDDLHQQSCGLRESVNGAQPATKRRRIVR